MHSVSNTWRQITASRYSTNVFLIMDGIRYDSESLYSLTVHSSMFSGHGPSVGGAMSAEIDVEMVAPARDPSSEAKMEIRVSVTDGKRTSEEISKGIFYIDTREKTAQGGEEVLTLHGYDAMLYAEADYPDTSHPWPYPDYSVVKEIADGMGLALDSSTELIVTNGYEIPSPVGMSMRETLGYIAAMYAGSFVISDDGKLKFIRLARSFSYGADNYLGTETGEPIEIGGELIVV